MNDLILTIVSSLTLSGALTVFLVFLARSWISQRLKSAIENEYAENLERYKARLKTEHDLALERIKASNAQNQAMQATATASLTSAHTAAQEKRLKALETLWNAIVELRTKSYTVWVPEILPVEFRKFWPVYLIAQSQGYRQA
jgi:ABC-type bacteriocin/lantibiotic exporter with double-glycine peptidase domain